MEMANQKSSPLHRVLRIEHNVSPECGEIDVQMKTGGLPLITYFRELFQAGADKFNFKVAFRDLALLSKRASTEQFEKIEQLLAIKLSLMARSGMTEAPFSFDISVGECVFHRQFFIELCSALDSFGKPEYLVSIKKK